MNGDHGGRAIFVVQVRAWLPLSLRGFVARLVETLLILSVAQPCQLVRACGHAPWIGACLRRAGGGGSLQSRRLSGLGLFCSLWAAARTVSSRQLLQG